MKKLGIVSLTLAALLLSGCGDKGEHKAQAQQKSEAAAVAKQENAQPQKESVKIEPVKEEAQATSNEESSKSSSDVAQAAQEASKNAAQSATEATKEAKEDVAEEAQEKVEEGVQKVQEAAAAATAAVTGAKAAEQTNETAAAVDGAKLYAKCASCHGPKGERKALGKSAVIAGMPKDEVLKKLKGYQAGTLNQYGMGTLMKGQVAGLSEADLEALADYISKLK